MKTGTGWERGRRVHFDEIAADYDKIRWDYPEALYQDIFRYAGTGRKALEIGAGTGKATVPFLTAGYDVTAVEMGVNMSAFLSDKFKDRNNFKVITSTFEDAVLEEDSYDLIYAASAFHWVDADIGCPKVFRLLKNGGVFALFRNNMIPAVGEELYEETQAVYEKHYYSHFLTDERPVRIPKEDFWKPSELYRGFRFENMEQYGFCDLMKNLYDAKRKYTTDEYMALMDTMSDHRSLPESNRIALYEGIRNAIEKHGGYREAEYVYQLYAGRKVQ